MTFRFQLSFICGKRPIFSSISLKLLSLCHKKLPQKLKTFFQIVWHRIFTCRRPYELCSMLVLIGIISILVKIHKFFWYINYELFLNIWIVTNEKESANINIHIPSKIQCRKSLKQSDFFVHFWLKFLKLFQAYLFTYFNILNEDFI